MTEKGYLFKLEKGKLTEETGPFSGSNGIAWSLDDTIMYFVDSMPDRKLYAFDYDIEKGAVCKFTPVYPTKSHVPHSEVNTSILFSTRIGHK